MRHALGPSFQRGVSLKAVLLLLALLAGAGWYLWTHPEHLPDQIRRELPAETVIKPLYKWRDANGQWNITDQPPASGEYETIRVHPETNVVPTIVPGQTERPED